MRIPSALVAYLPSPSSNGLNLGSLHLRAYGLLIAVGVVAAVWLAERRWQALGGDPDVIPAIAVWAVPAGLVGARLYHVITDFELYRHHLIGAVEIWHGGLGIWGGVAFGVPVGLWAARRKGVNTAAMLDACAPAIALAQAIGRWGNYFNQELFGRPTTLPWALEISPAHRPVAYARDATFQPTFLYESLWDLVVVLLLIVLGRRLRIRRGYLFAVYVALYTFGRFWIEYLRIDFAHRFLGLRLNDWISILVFTTAVLLLVFRGRLRPGDARVGDPLASEPQFS